MIEVAWWLFLVTSLVLIVTPGQDMVLVMSRSIAQGPGAGIATAAGVSVDLVGHTVLATLSLDAILRTSK
jgi:threonine/homoserine/homoserine lactone efflux protein